MNRKYYGLQISYLLLFISALLGIYLFFSFEYYSKKFLERIAKGHEAVFITADGLLTTSTFAFVAFSSLSPSSSRSSVFIRRLDWKGTWVFRYSVLLVTSVVLTLISCLLILENLSFLVISVTLSSVIVIYIIIKYVLYHKSSEIKSSKRFMNIVKNLNYTPTKKQLSKKGDGEFSHKIKNILRPLINPLKGTHNIDLLRLILSSK